jgi:hypothetical protein
MIYLELKSLYFNQFSFILKFILIVHTTILISPFLEINYFEKVGV